MIRFLHLDFRAFSGRLPPVLIWISAALARQVGRSRRSLAGVSQGGESWSRTRSSSCWAWSASSFSGCCDWIAAGAAPATHPVPAPTAPAHSLCFAEVYNPTGRVIFGEQEGVATPPSQPARPVRGASTLGRPACSRPHDGTAEAEQVGGYPASGILHSHSAPGPLAPATCPAPSPALQLTRDASVPHVTCCAASRPQRRGGGGR
jgi:hypothetical protein